MLKKLHAFSYARPCLSEIYACVNYSLGNKQLRNGFFIELGFIVRKTEQPLLVKQGSGNKNKISSNGALDNPKRQNIKILWMNLMEDVWKCY